MDYCEVGLGCLCGPTLYLSLRICLKPYELCRINELTTLDDSTASNKSDLVFHNLTLHLPSGVVTLNVSFNGGLQ